MSVPEPQPPEPEPQPPEPEPQPPEPAAYALHVQAKEFLQRLGVRLTPLAVGTCDHRNEEPGYNRVGGYAI